MERAYLALFRVETLSFSLLKTCAETILGVERDSSQLLPPLIKPELSF